MNPEQIIEALLFVADSPLKPRQIIEIWEGEEFQDIPMTEELLMPIMEGLMDKYKAEQFIFELRQIDGGYQFFTKREFFPYARHAAMIKSKRRLSRSSLEVLSVIAYRQPVSKTEIEFIRGVNCDHALAKLLDKKLVEIAGRSSAAGRPLLYKTTSYFMEYFGINDLGDLPRVEEFGMTEVQYQAQFRSFMEEREIEDSLKRGEINDNEAQALREMRDNEDLIPPLPERLRKKEDAPTGQDELSLFGHIELTTGEETLTETPDTELADEASGNFEFPTEAWDQANAEAGDTQEDLPSDDEDEPTPDGQEEA
jgi:segregation and condensation protein B